MLGLPTTTLLVGKYEVGEPRLLGHGRYGPVIRARDMHSRELVAVKVFNAAEAFHSGRLAGCTSLAEARWPQYGFQLNTGQCATSKWPR